MDTQIRQAINEELRRNSQHARGIVTAVYGANPYQVDVKLDGADVATPKIWCSKGLAPAVNDYVLVHVLGANDYLVTDIIPV